MATLYVTEYAKMAWAGSNLLPAPFTPPIAEQAIAITGASVQSSPFHADTTFVQVACDSTCSLAWGVNPVAVTSAHRLGAGEVRFYGIRTGDSLAVIANT